jgi:FlaA1/EpsC-like NDP-sugar epimerase
VFTGVRHGERLAEDLLGPGEGWRSTAHESIREVVTPVPTSIDDLEWTINHLWELAKEQRSSELVRALKQSVWTRALSDVAEPGTTFLKQTIQEQPTQS